MLLLVDTARSGPAAELPGADYVSIGLVNNMPDAAFEATERQFIDLIRAAAPEIVVCLKLFSIADVSRAQRVQSEITGRYRPVAELRDTMLDGIIVTGTEPCAASLKEEPYWPAVTELVDWAGENTASTIWSCLAAHAAVLHADGIERSPLASKLFGVFDCETIACHPLFSGAELRRVPHSRYNDLSETALRSSGYRILSRSATAGIDAFTKKQQGSSLFVFLQGHPEYETATLLREYRRDVGRFLRHEREDYPAAPQGYLNEEAMALLDAFRVRAIDDRRESLIANFPMLGLEANLENTWRESAISIYQNWIGFLKDRKEKWRSGLARSGTHAAMPPRSTAFADVS